MSFKITYIVPDPTLSTKVKSINLTEKEPDSNTQEVWITDYGKGIAIGVANVEGSDILNVRVSKQAIIEFLEKALEFLKEA